MIMRQREHKEANAARQVTTEARKERAVTKLTDGTDLEIQVVVFRVTSMKNPSHKFKVVPRPQPFSPTWYSPTRATHPQWFCLT